jgi:hypothetical protein
MRLRTGIALATAAGVAIGALVLVAAPQPASAAIAPLGNLSQALQESLYFYDAEKSGPARTLGQQPLEWRGDSEPSDGKVPLISSAHTVAGTNLSTAFINQWSSVLDPNKTGFLDLSGGFHDAGDHVKFGLPQAYAAAELGWGVLEFKDAFVATGSYTHAMSELRWFSDYFLRSTFLDPATGNVIAFNYMVGNGTIDHTYWGPPELQNATTYPRPAEFAWSGAPGSDVSAEAAAALTIEYFNTLSSDPTYAAKCLAAAKALYQFGVTYRGLGNGDGFYTSSGDEDHLAWAAAWLYQATNTASYLNDIIGKDSSGNYTGYLKKIIAGPQDNWQNIWVQSWDSVWSGVFAKLAVLTKGVVSAAENAKYQYYFRWNLEYWTGGQVKHQDTTDTTFLKPTPAGFGVINTWGSARYNAAAQFSALVFRHDNPTDPEATPLTDWALSQMNYLMGNNPLKTSYIVGFAPSGYSDVSHPHHRAAHGSMTNNMGDPVNDKHVLWGGLVGGPDASDGHTDVTTDFVGNEVALDYEAGFVGSLAGLFDYYGSGQSNVAWTPTPEATELPPYAMAKIEQENNQRTQVTVTINNYLTHPPHFETQLSLKYFFNISELMAHGQTISAVHTETYYDESASSYNAPATISAIQPFDAANGIYYVEVSWPNIPVSGKRDYQFGLIAAQDSTYQSWWDPTNDWSHTGLSSTTSQITTYIPVYRNEVLVYGNEPTKGTPPPTTPPPTTVPPTTVPPTTVPPTTVPPTTVPPTTVPPTTPPATTPPVTGACAATYSITNSWSTGFQAGVTVTAGKTAISNWKVTWTLPSGQAITQLWSGTLAQSGSAITVTNASFNGSLAAGASTTFGFTANGSSTPSPTLTCTGS